MIKVNKERIFFNHDDEKKDSSKICLCHDIIFQESCKIVIKIIFKKGYTNLIKNIEKISYETELYELMTELVLHKRFFDNNFRMINKYKNIINNMEYIFFRTNKAEIIRKVINELNDYFIPKISDQVESIEEYVIKLSQFAINYVLYTNTKYIGLLSYYVDKDKKEVYITLIGIIKDFQNRQLGNILLDLVFYEVKIFNLNVVRLEVQKSNEHAIKFYIKNGFLYEKEASENSIYLKFVVNKRV